MALQIAFILSDYFKHIYFFVELFPFLYRGISGRRNKFKYFNCFVLFVCSGKAVCRLGKIKQIKFKEPKKWWINSNFPLMALEHDFKHLNTIIRNTFVFSKRSSSKWVPRNKMIFFGHLTMLMRTNIKRFCLTSFKWQYCLISKY